MRLGGYILLELAVGTALAAGTVSGAYVGGRALWGAIGGDAHAQPARIQRADLAAEAARTEAPVVRPGLAELGLVPLDRPRHHGREDAGFTLFHGVRDDYLLAPLRAGKVKRAKFNRGGSSISLRVDLDNGARAAFKPDQTNLQTIPRKEVAAFRLDRLLGLGAVPPAIARALPQADIVAALDPDSRGLLPRFLAEVPVPPGGLLTGELSWWIPEIDDARIGGYDIRDVDGMVLWKRYLTVGEPIPEGDRGLVAQISSLVAFDFLINNPDRWSGNNTKVSPDRQVLYFMDNTLSFAPEREGNKKVWTYLCRSQKFSRSLLGGLRALDEEEVRRLMLTDTGPYRRLLTEREIEGLMFRRDRLVAYIDELVAEHGASSVLVFP